MKLAIVGGGQMGEALVGGLLDAGWAQAGELLVVEVIAARRDYLEGKYGVAVTAKATDAGVAPVVLLAVKPQDIDSAVDAIAGAVTETTLVLSIAAGVPIARIQSRLRGRVPVVRIMPNTPALVREGAAALAPGEHATADHLDRAEEILSKVGRTVRLAEKHLDAVTALSGSGPAYVFLLAEALIEAGVAAGLPRDVASELAIQTILGSARMLRETGKHPAELREMVTSPGGTTAAALRVLERAGVRSAFIEAIQAAAQRSRELA